jgi:hypothetical protein
MRLRTLLKNPPSRLFAGNELPVRQDPNLRLRILMSDDIELFLRPIPITGETEQFEEDSA